MKILFGVYKGIELAVPLSGTARPTVDHFKKNIFKEMERLGKSSFSKELWVWDLFAGGGGVGLEFLSLYQTKTVFVEKDKNACLTINLNVAECRLKHQIVTKTNSAFPETQIIQSSIEDFLRNLAKDQKKFETVSPQLIFLDPPYGEGFPEKTLQLLNRFTFLPKETLIVAEYIDTDSFGFENLNFEVLSHSEYGPKRLTIFEATK